MQSASSNDPVQMPEDFSAQFEEFKTLAYDVLHGNTGYLAIEETLDETLGVLEERLKSKKKMPRLETIFYKPKGESASISDRTNND